VGVDTEARVLAKQPFVGALVAAQVPLALRTGWQKSVRSGARITSFS